MDSRVTGIEIKTDEIYKVKEIGKEIRQKLGFPFWTKDWMEMNRNLFRPEVGKDRHVYPPCPDRPGGGFQYHLHTHHGGDGEEQGYCHPEVNGYSFKGDLKDFHHRRRSDRCGRNSPGINPWPVLHLNWKRSQDLLRTFLVSKFFPDVYYIDKLPSQVNPSDVVRIVITAILISLLATLYPSWRASKLDPAEALRYE